MIRKTSKGVHRLFAGKVRESGHLLLLLTDCLVRLRKMVFKQCHSSLAVGQQSQKSVTFKGLLIVWMTHTSTFTLKRKSLRGF